MEQETVFIVDDDAAVRDSIKELVESVGLYAESFGSAHAFLESFQPQRAGCLVLDVRMAKVSGLELQQKLNELGTQIPIIMITGHGDVPMAVHALKAGAVDFIQKPYRDQLLLDSINNALAVGAAASDSPRVPDEYDEALAALTAREREVLDRLLEGGTSKQIARELGISHRTVEAHRGNLLRKLDLRSVKELILHQASRNRAD